MSTSFNIGDSVRRAAAMQPYVRQPGDPVHRPLWVYSTDPAASKLDGSRVKVNVPYEPLAPGPVGQLFEVIGTNFDTFETQPPVDLEDPRLLITAGRKPTADNAQFQMQMTYAVAMNTWSAFRKALGRIPHWGFTTPEGTPSRLKIYPCSGEQQNAYYDRESQALRFGWYKATEFSQGRNPKHGRVFTSLSHDIIAHEVSHALLDGLRPSFLLPFHHDTLALHEAFADLVAVFQHFTHRQLVQRALQKTRGKLTASHMLTGIARQFGQTTDVQAPSLRSAVEVEQCSGGVCRLSKKFTTYQQTLPIHDLGSVLVTAVFEAYTTIFTRKTRRLIKLASSGTGILPEGDLPDTLASMLAKAASELAEQFLSICIRAIDYCPPVAVRFGDYLRAMITADFDLVPDDPYGYREALVDAFVKRQIPIEGVGTYAESSLLWPLQDEPLDDELLSAIQTEPDELRVDAGGLQPHYDRRARRVGEYLMRSQSWKRLSLSDPTIPAADGRLPEVPTIESARISRRISPDGQLETDLVAEITQSVSRTLRGATVDAIQGCTMIVDMARSRIRYLIGNSVDEYVTRLDDSSDTFIAEHWRLDGSRHVPQGEVFARMHKPRAV